jgi:repressor LexA
VARGSSAALGAAVGGVDSYSEKQGQYLAFIYYYTKLNGRAPSEADMQGYFRVSPPTVHQMILSLEKNEFIQRTPGEARSIRLLLSRKNLPDLD